MYLRRLLLFRPPQSRYFSSFTSSPFPFDSHRQNSGGDDPNRFPPNPLYTSDLPPSTSSESYSPNSFSTATPNTSWGYGSPSSAVGESLENQQSYTGNFSNPGEPQFSSGSTHSAAAAAAPQFQLPTPAAPFVSQRSYGFSSAEEAAAERRRRKRRLRIEPPLYALRPNPPQNPSNADKPRLPDSTSALVGPRLNLHNRVQSLIRAGDLDSASYIARQSVFQYIRPTVFTCNAIIAAMYRAKRYSDTKALFQYFFRQFDIIPNIVSYNNLIVSHCESNEIEEALKVYEYILENAPYSPSSVTYRHLTKGLIDSGRMDDAVSLLREMLHKGHGADSLVYNNVILGYLILGDLEKANELFDELKERCTVYDGVVNATFMDWFFNQGKPKEAMESYRDLMSRNYRMVPATRNVLLETLLKHGKKKESWALFQDMLDDHTPPTFQAVNSDTISMMVNECIKEGNIDEAMEVFARSGKGEKSKPFQMDVAGFNNMIAKMCELEMMDKAEDYYKQLCGKSLTPDVNTYRTLIEAYIKLDKVDEMLEKYTKMVDAGLRVIPPYANKWFMYVVEKGRACDCLPILSKMVDREPKPDVTTYDVVIRGLVEDGKFDESVNLMNEMVNQGVGFTALLKDYVLNGFEKIGRKGEIDDIFSRSLRGGRSPMPWQNPQSNRFEQRHDQTYQQGQGERNPLPWRNPQANQFEERQRAYQQGEGVGRRHAAPISNALGNQFEQGQQTTYQQGQAGGGSPAAAMPWQIPQANQFEQRQEACQQGEGLGRSPIAAMSWQNQEANQIDQKQTTYQPAASMAWQGNQFDQQQTTSYQYGQGGGRSPWETGQTQAYQPQQFGQQSG